MNVALLSAVSKNTCDPHIVTLPYDSPSTREGQLSISPKSSRAQGYVAFPSVTSCIIPLGPMTDHVP